MKPSHCVVVWSKGGAGMAVNRAAADKEIRRIFDKWK